MVFEKVTIITEVLDKATNKLKKISESTRQLNRLQGTLTETTRKLNSQTGKMDLALRKTTRGVKSFNFAWLSVMFAGMALTRVFGGLIKAQFQLFGITELFTNLMTIILLPLMELLLPIFLKLFEIFSELPDGVKLAIGAFILLGFVFGILLMIIGQVALAVGGFTLLWPVLGTAAAAVIGGIVGSLGLILGVIAIIIIIVAGMFIAWKNNFLGMKTIVDNFISGVKQIFNGLVGVIGGVLNIIKGIFLGDFELVKQGIVMIFNGLIDIIKGKFKALTSFILGVFVGALQVVWNIVKLIIDGIKFIVTGIGKLGGKTPSIGLGLPGRQSGGIIPETGPFMLHKGEKVLPAHQARGSSGEIVINQTNVINVSDKRELEDMIRRNNLKLTDDIRRLAQKI